jgi:hypothetical protein
VPAPEVELTRAYYRWCEGKRKPSDCLHLLEASPSVDADGRYALALAIAMDSVWNATAEALEDMADPVAVQATLVSAMTMYLMLWVLPEPVSKGIAATLSVGLIAYLGVNATWSLIQGWKRLVVAVDRASTFDEVREAGARFGEVLGTNAARVFILLTTAALGSSAGLATKLPTLPGAAQAARLAEAQGGFRLMAVAQVDAVAVSAEGFTIALAPGAVAMTAGSMGGGSGSAPRGYKAFRSFESFKRAMGPAGQGKQWHHVVEQTPGNVERFGPEALHNTENVIALESDIHSKVSRLYSSNRPDITRSETLTVRKWLSTQSYEAQRRFGQQAIENVRKGLWP